MSKTNLVKRLPFATAGAVAVAQAFILAYALGNAEGADPRSLWLVPAVTVIAALLAGFFHARGWYALLCVYVLGLIVGDVSALDIARQPVEGLFFVATVTVVFFAGLGLAVGLIAEFVRLIHYLVHGGRVWRYPKGELKAESLEPRAGKGE